MAKVRQYSSPVLLQSVVRSSLYTGVVIAGPIMNPWKKAFEAVCPYVCQALASGLMISVVSENTSTADVYKRWVAFGLLSSHSRLHGSTSYRVPWVYDEEAVDVVRFFTRLKAKLMPYLYKTAITASKTGIPCMRSMVLEYTEDKMCNYLDKQYMLGDNLLVAPIFNDESRAEYYLPAGIWTNFFTGKGIQGRYMG